MEHILAHLQLVFLQFTIHRQYVQPPFILFGLVQRYLVLMIREGLAKSTHTKIPDTRFAQGFFVFGADTILGDLYGAPAICATLIAEAAHIVALVAKKVPETGNI